MEYFKRILKGFLFGIAIGAILGMCTNVVYATDWKKKSTQTQDQTNVSTNNIQGTSYADGGNASQGMQNSNNNDTLALGLNNSLGDVAIDDCVATKQWASPVISHQYFKINKWCAANWYDSRGMHDAAARVRCDIKEIRRLYDNSTQCVTANTDTRANEQLAILRRQVKTLLEERQHEREVCDERVERCMEAVRK